MYKSGFKINSKSIIFHDTYLSISVLTTPGCKEVAIPFNPAQSILLCNSLVNSIFAALERPQAIPAIYPLLQLISQKSILRLIFGKPNPLCASELTLITLNSSDFLIFSQRRQVRQKWPKWLVPICISKPSAVTLLSGIPTPALLIRMSILSTCSFTLLAKSLIEFLSAKSKGKNCIFAPLFSFKISLMVSYDFLESLAPKMIVQGLLESSLIVSLPMPVLAPVTTMILLLRSLSTLQDRPRAINLIAVKMAKVEEVMIAPVGVLTQFFSWFKYYIIYLWQYYTKHRKKQKAICQKILEKIANRQQNKDSQACNNFLIILIIIYKKHFKIDKIDQTTCYMHVLQ